MTQDVKAASECRRSKINKHPKPMPQVPWQRVVTDLCEFGGKYYIVISDSQYIMMQ